MRFVKMGLYKKPPFRPMGAIEPPLLPYCVWKGVKFTPLAQLVGRRKGDRLPPKAGERVFLLRKANAFGKKAKSNVLSTFANSKLLIKA